MKFCALCGFTQSSETHKEPFGRLYAGVYYTHEFKVPEKLANASENGKCDDPHKN